MRQTFAEKSPTTGVQARTTYDDPEQPQNDLLQDLYQDALLDAHLQAVQQKRILALQNKEFVLRRADGEVDEEKSKWMQQLWFRAIVGYALESRFLWLQSHLDCRGRPCRRAIPPRARRQTAYAAATRPPAPRARHRRRRSRLRGLPRGATFLPASGATKSPRDRLPDDHRQAPFARQLGRVLSRSSACRCVSCACRTCRVSRSERPKK